MTLEDLSDFWGARDVKTEMRKTLMFGVAGILLGIIAPYDSSQLPVAALRYVYWISLLLMTSVISGPAARFLFPFCIKRRMRTWFGFLLYCALVSLPVFALVIVGDIFFANPGKVTYATALAFLRREAGGVADVLIWFGQVLVLTVIVFGGVSLVVQQAWGRRAAAGAAAMGLERRGIRFLNRLPARLGPDLLCLATEDHYLRVYTARGDTLILMRMRDAVLELEDYPGLQVHRSWWVAKAAIRRVTKEGRKYMLGLENGLSVPVSRTYAHALASAGLI